MALFQECNQGWILKKMHIAGDILPPFEAEGSKISVFFQRKEK